MNFRKTKFYKTLNHYIACAYAEGFCEGEDATEQEQLTAYQYLIDTGIVWRLQGHNGRVANSLIEEGILRPAK